MMYLYEHILIVSNLFILVCVFYKLLYWHLYRMQNPLRLRATQLALGILTVLIVQTRSIRLFYIFHVQRMPYEIVVHSVLSVVFWFLFRRILRAEAGNRKLDVHSIQAAMDSIHLGICICKPSGTPVLVNAYMYALTFRLTGRSLLNANLLWEKLERKYMASKDRLTKMNLHYLTDRSEGEEVYVISDQNEVYRFRKYRTCNENGEFVEIMATDITNTAALISDIHEQNLRLNEQNIMMYEQLRRRYDINKSKEILKSKIGLHRKLGEAIIATKSVIQKEATLGVDELKQFWNNVLDDLVVKKSVSRKNEQDEFEEIQKIASMLECEIDCSPDIFETLAPMQLKLFVDLVREALFNAIRHGRANCLYIRKTELSDSVRLHIFDNGTFEKKTLQINGGMRNLMEMYKEHNANLRIYLGKNGVEMDVQFQKEGVV